MKVKTSELTGTELDWSVAKAVGQRVKILPIDNEKGQWQIQKSGILDAPYWPSYEWSQCGPLIAEYRVDFHGEHDALLKTSTFSARCDDGQAIGWQCGPAPQIAICRAVVAAKLGDEVEIPSELFKGE